MKRILGKKSSNRDEADKNRDFNSSAGIYIFYFDSNNEKKRNRAPRGQSYNNDQCRRIALPAEGHA